MTEEKRTIHVLKDEKLGVDREYVAVDRAANVGEMIVIVEPENTSGDVANAGHYGLIIEDDSVKNALIADFKGFDNHFVLDDGIQRVGEAGNYYHVLEPTDIVHIDGERYRLEDRKAEVGERVFYVNKENGKSDGIDTIVTSAGVDIVYVREYKDDTGEAVCSICHGYYYVLTPVQDATEPKESDVITVLANLGAEVAELKRTVAHHQAEFNALREQLAKVASGGGTKMELTGNFIADIIIGLKKAGL